MVCVKLGLQGKLGAGGQGVGRSGRTTTTTTTGRATYRANILLLLVGTGVSRESHRAIEPIAVALGRFSPRHPGLFDPLALPSSPLALLPQTRHAVLAAPVARPKGRVPTVDGATGSTRAVVGNTVVGKEGGPGGGRSTRHSGLPRLPRLPRLSKNPHQKPMGQSRPG